MYENHKSIDCIIKPINEPHSFLSQIYFDVLKVSKLIYILLLFKTYSLDS